MADEAALALQPGGSPSAAAAETEAPSPPAGEPLRKRPRRDGPGAGRSPGEPGGAAPERELPAAASGCPAAALWREAQAVAAGEGDNGPGLQGLSREAPPADDSYDDDDEGEEEEEAAAAEAIGYRDNLLFGDEIITNGFHSCESDEDDRASHASSSDWTPRPRIVDFPDLPDPQAMFDIEYFRKDPRPFFKFAKEIYPGQFQPSLCHKFIALSDKEGKLLRNYTQNIDTLEQVAGIQRIIQCHGSFATASCLICKYKVDCEAVRGDIFNQVVPRCPRCPADEPLAIMKPEIVFFGENLPEQFHRAMKYDKDEVDLLIVIGSSLKVRPVALIPSSIPHEVPQILINREPLPHLHFDVELLGDCDVIINELCHRLGGEYAKLCCNPVKLLEITEKPPRTQKELAHLSELPPTPLNISEGSSSPERTSPPDSSMIVTQILDQETKSSIDDPGVSESKDCVEEKSQEVQTSIRSTESVSEQLESPDLKNVASNTGEKNERTSVAETVRKCWPARLAKEQISKRLDGNQYLFLPPNRYIFHGAEVYSDSEDDVLSSSSCGSNSDSGTCQSPSLEEPMEDESEIEEFYNGLEDDADVNERVGGTGFGANGGNQEAVNEVSMKQEATSINYPSNKS
ncbi:NAD-dependent protein deacetylase sirtuin-1 isoform X2 [Hippopotamus amphibius kiboko]|uniref:NAD-dependent protein deacetylase sirtuin-1 isoform X2 n=1 Tax=Hippopotamus amphibius kiboko TaxID=575201 RepID=UPI0025990650|nr:NAD-dependent protein deacetylase sirtuin-1 isoform X2 [Hippopotamus amphibius kiboko]